MNTSRYSPALHRYALLVVLCALGLIAIGGLVTSKGVGMAVPDWPTSYGYNMFALPFSIWLTGGVFQEHTHRQWASVLGVLVVVLTRWLGGRESRRSLMIIGATELVGGFLMALLGDEWQGGGHFLSGIGGVVLAAGIVWVRNNPAPKPLPTLGWAAFWLVQLQGLLGGLRVVLDAHFFAGTRLGILFGVFHGCLAQVFFVLLAIIALKSSRWWCKTTIELPKSASGGGILFIATTGLIFCQLVIGATMRHQHAGLAISDFPLAYGAWWPDMSAGAIARYNAARTEVVAVDPITAFQVGLQMAHRIMALVILIGVGWCIWRIRTRSAKGTVIRRFGWLWLCLLLAQIALGAWTIWSNKAADVATLHVVVGALSLTTGALICVIISRFNFRCCGGG